MGNTVTTLGSISTFGETSTDSSSVSLYWSGSYKSVILEQDTNSVFYTATSTTINTSADMALYTVSGLLSNTKYYYRITPVVYQTYTGVDASGTVVAWDVSGTTLATVNDFSAISLSTDTIKLTWDGSFSSVTLQQSPDFTEWTTIITEINDISYSVTGLITEKLYYFRAYGINSTGVINTNLLSIAYATTNSM
jgi:hypothetical protein